MRDSDLSDSLDELLSARETLTRSLLGAGDNPSGPPAPPEEFSVGWTAY